MRALKEERGWNTYSDCPVITRLLFGTVPITMSIMCSGQGVNMRDRKSVV